MTRLSRAVARSIVLASLLSGLAVLLVLWFAIGDERVFWLAAAALVLSEVVAAVLIFGRTATGAQYRSRPLVGRQAEPIVPFHRSGTELVGQVLVAGELWSAVLLGEREPPSEGPYIVAGFEGERLIVRRERVPRR